MNSTRYIFARWALACGIHMKTKRLSEAAEEMHLLRQAEEILGEDVWEQVEEVEEVHIDYWTLRKHQLELAKLEEKIGDADTLLNSSHDERNTILNHTNEVCQELEESRDKLIKGSEELIAKRDEIISRAQQIKKRFDASRTKVAVLSSQETEGYNSDNKSTIEKERKKLAEYKNSFAKLKAERAEIGVELSDFDEKISKIEEELSEDRKKMRSEAASAYQNIGKANRDKSKLCADVGIIEEVKKQHFAEIGRYVSNHAGTDPICTQICKEHSHLVAQMQTLRSSIALNHKLAAMAEA